MKIKKIFKQNQFTKTEFHDTKEKSDFANWLVAFIEAGYPREAFSKRWYTLLSCCFGHIAHFDIHGFYDTKFIDPEARAAFLRGLLRAHCSGDPGFTMSDVEDAIQKHLRANGHLGKAEKIVAENIERHERAELARLKAKYEEKTA